MAGSLIKIDEEIVSSAVASVTLTGIDSTYDVYMVRYNNLTSDTDDNNNRLRFTHSGTPQTTSVYDTADKKLNSNTSFENRALPNANYIRLDQFLGTGTSETAQGIIYLFNMNSTTEYAFCTFEGVTYNYVPFSAGGQGGAVFKNTGTARDGVNFSVPTGNYTAGKFVLYGLAK
jgi:hypothetical protein